MKIIIPKEWIVLSLYQLFLGGTFPNIFIFENVPQNFNDPMQAVTEYQFGIEFYRSFI